MNDRKKIFLNIVTGLTAQAIMVIMGLIIPRVVLVSYGSEVNGLLNSITQIYMYAGLLEAGVGTATMQALYKAVACNDKAEIQGIIAATNSYYKKVGYIYTFLVFFISIAYPLFMDTTIENSVVFGVVLFTGLSNVIPFLYQGKYTLLMKVQGEGYIISIFTAIFNIFINLAKVILLANGVNVVWVQLSYLLVSVAQMLCYFLYIKYKYGWIDLSVKPDRQAISQKKYAFVHQISALVFNNTDVILLMIFLKDLKIISVYSMYNLIISMLNNFMVQVADGFNFKLGQLYTTNKEKYEVVHHIFETICIIVSFTVMTIAFFCILPFLRLYTSGVSDISYINEIYPLMFVLVPLLTFGRTAASNVISFAGHFKQTTSRAIIESAINIVVSCLFVHKFGIIGVLFGTIVASLYRSNDIILYVYKYFLSGKVINTYKRWGIAFLTFGVGVYFGNYNRVIGSYGELIMYALAVGIISLSAYVIVEFAINYREISDFRKLVRKKMKVFK